MDKEAEVQTDLHTIGYATLQFHKGGLMGEPVEEFIHLVRRTERGTPGPTLCGFDRFSKDSAGWSVGGGYSGQWKPCRECDEGRNREFPVEGMHLKLFPTVVTERLASYGR